MADGKAGEAAATFHDLALAGDAEAAFNLALLFATGRGVPRNMAEAAYWAWRARLAGVHQAPVLLKTIWPRADASERMLIAQRLEAELVPLAEAGDGKAMLQLAAVLTEVREAPDLASAHIWLSLAATLGLPGASTARDQAFAALPPEDQAKADRVVLSAFSRLCDRLASDMPACLVVMTDDDSIIVGPAASPK